MPQASKTRTGRLRALGFTSVAVSLVAWLAFPDLLLPQGASRIGSWNANQMFDECFVPTGQRPDNFWRPSSDVVREAEAGLAELLAARRRAGLKMPEDSPAERPFQFHHQYLGFVMAGERVLLINAFPSYPDDPFMENGFGLFERPVCVADGGRHFWRVLYHPATQTFSRFEFNGPG